MRGGRRRDEPSPGVPPAGAPEPRGSERHPPGPPDLASECTPGCRSSGRNPDFSLGIRRESGPRARPRFARALGLQDIVRRAFGHRGACTDPQELGAGWPTVPGWGRPPAVVSGARWPRAFVCGLVALASSVRVRCSRLVGSPETDRLLRGNRKYGGAQRESRSLNPPTYNFSPCFTLAYAHFSLS